jgi:hypothetical protein
VVSAESGREKRVPEWLFTHRTRGSPGDRRAALDATQIQSKRSDQKRQFTRVEQALHGYAMINGQLPCADTDGNGLENRTGGDCESGADQGALPTATLGLSRRDAWGHPLYYAVTPGYAGDPEDSAPETSAFTFDDDGTLDIFDDHDPATRNPVAQEVPAVVVSFAAQGGQVWTDSGFVCPGAGTGFSDNEIDNCDGDDFFVDAGYSSAESGERFDDMIIWLSDPVLKSRMVDAAKLP